MRRYFDYRALTETLNEDVMDQFQSAKELLGNKEKLKPTSNDDVLKMHDDYMEAKFKSAVTRKADELESEFGDKSDKDASNSDIDAMAKTFGSVCGIKKDEPKEQKKDEPESGKGKGDVRFDDFKPFIEHETIPTKEVRENVDLGVRRLINQYDLDINAIEEVKVVKQNIRLAGDKDTRTVDDLLKEWE